MKRRLRRISTFGLAVTFALFTSAWALGGQILKVAFRFDPQAASLWEKTRYGVYKLLYGEYPPKHVINYIWANRLPKGTAIDNAYTDRAKMIAVESGSEEVGRWLLEERNLYEDYKRLFGEEPPRIAGIALMTDTDNTGESAVAYYDDIALRSVERGSRQEEG